MHLVDRGFKMRTYSLGSVPMGSESHTSENIAKMWKSMLHTTLSVPNVTAPVITTDGAANIKGAAIK